jgi:DUF1680 family protein
LDSERDSTTTESSQGKDFLLQVDQTSRTIADDSEKIAFFERGRSQVPQSERVLPARCITPTGWLSAMMENDLQRGMVGALDDLYPGIRNDDIYGADRRGGQNRAPDMGDLVLAGDPWETSISWWNAETAGNWWDGFIRHAFLTQDKSAIAKARAIVDRLLRSQDADGYIGIYQPNLRYRHEGANGELWAQTTAFRALLSYYEFSLDESALAAVERAMSVSIQVYGPAGRSPFRLKNSFGGATHGLMITDVCDTLYRLTGKEVYQEFATHLYQEFSRYSVNRAFNDMRYSFLVDRNEMFVGHGVHTYEHLRPLLQAYLWSGYEELKTAWDNALHKLRFTILPSGAGHGAEFIVGRVADPDFTATEYCTTLELRNSLLFALEKTGDLGFADHAELLTFNGMMGLRNPDGTALTYNKQDNCPRLNSRYRTESGDEKDVRFKYSPTHSDPAVCCVPNYGRNLPTYLQYMWMQSPGGITAMLYGPSDLRFQYGEHTIRIRQETDYPLSDHVTMKIDSEAPIRMSIQLRRPGWCTEMRVGATGAESESLGSLVRLTKTWQTGDTISIRFLNETTIMEAQNGDRYFQRGPIVYAAPIPHDEETIKEYDRKPFRDYHCHPKGLSIEQLCFSPEVSLIPEYRPANGRASWHRNMPELVVRLVDRTSQETRSITLKPMGSTILRRVTFKTLPSGRTTEESQ